MYVFHSEKHNEHTPRHEFTGGTLIKAFDSPERINNIADTLRFNSGFDFESPVDFGVNPIHAIHTDDYLSFLPSVFEKWQAAGLGDSPMASNVAGRPKGPCPEHIEGQIGYFANASDTMIDQGTWGAAYDSAQCAVNAAQYVAAQNANFSFALCRPPGHHCEADRYGGYCYLNNAAIAAQHLRGHGVPKVGLLDIDFHHGNGTQAIFYDRSDVFYGSVHGDTALTYPFFSGYAGETGSGDGKGKTLNLPLPPGSGNIDWLEAISRQLESMMDFGATALVISLGVDAHHTDPQSFFNVKTDAFAKAGRLIHATGKPTVVIMEGGYAMAAIGPCVLAFLLGLENI